MKILCRYDLSTMNSLSIPTIDKVKKGDYIKVKDLIKYLKSFDSSDEIINTMDYIIRTQLSE
jgi:hypothetical protein